MFSSSLCIPEHPACAALGQLRSLRSAPEEGNSKTHLSIVTRNPLKAVTMSASTWRHTIITIIINEVRCFKSYNETIKLNCPIADIPLVKSEEEEEEERNENWWINTSSTKLWDLVTWLCHLALLQTISTCRHTHPQPSKRSMEEKYDLIEDVCYLFKVIILLFFLIYSQSDWLFLSETYWPNSCGKNSA